MDKQTPKRRLFDKLYQDVYYEHVIFYVLALMAYEDPRSLDYITLCDIATVK